MLNWNQLVLYPEGAAEERLQYRVSLRVPDSWRYGTALPIAHYKNLVAETGALFGSRHYRDYHFLLTLSDHVAHFGLEHHESSDDRVDERTLIDDGPRRLEASLLPHEFTHSWNGKYRRPAGLATGNFESPMKEDLLWVYEGLTNYLGEILAPCSGLLSPDDYREALARTANGGHSKIRRSRRSCSMMRGRVITSTGAASIIIPKEL